MTQFLKQHFSFFGKQISEKYGKKCCRYGLDGKPLTPQRVSQVYTELKSLLEGWRVSEDNLSIVRYFYTESYPLALKFLSDIGEMDAQEYKNCPSFEYKKGELLKVQLLSPSLNGLSHTDFDVAMKINQTFDLQKYLLVPVSDPIDYKREMMKMKFQKQSAQIQEELRQTEHKP